MKRKPTATSEKVTDAIMTVRKFLEARGEVERLVREAEARIKQSHFTPSERQMFRARLKRGLEQYGLGSLLQSSTENKIKPKSASSEKILSQALLLKQNAKYFENAGRQEEARRIRGKALALERRGNKLRAQEREKD